MTLLLVMLSPPMENFYAVTRAALPKTKGEEFYVGDLEGLRAEAPDGLQIFRNAVASFT